jgi:hypothetical protein
MEIGEEKSREMHRELWELKCWTYINRQTMQEVEWAFIDSIKLNNKMKL